MRLDVHGVRGVRGVRVRRVRRVRLALVAALVHLRVRAQLLAVLAVGALLVLEVPQPLVVALDLVAQRGVLDGGALLVQLEAAGAVQALQVDPASPPHAHAVHDESGHDMGLINKTKTSSYLMNDYDLLRIRTKKLEQKIDLR